ncbi:MAG: M15 family metallopeptidase [Gammaproteobacteria bacterium]
MRISQPASTGPPPPPPRQLSGLIGQYGRDDVLDIGEEAGVLRAHGFGFVSARLRHENKLQFFEASSGRRILMIEEQNRLVAEVDGVRMQRRDVGAELVDQFQQSLAGQLSARLSETGAHTAFDDQFHRGPIGRRPNFVSLADVVPSIRLEIRYASADNFMGFPVYDKASAWLRPAVAAALSRVAMTMRDRGYGLLIHDAYRPWSITRFFWDCVPSQYRSFLADPAVGSTHNRGCAIDLSLFDVESGAPVEMPSRYDEPTERSHACYSGGTSRQRWHRDLLRFAMEKEGFVVQPNEWWHFDFHAWREYPVENVAFNDLE